MFPREGITSSSEDPKSTGEIANRIKVAGVYDQNIIDGNIRKLKELGFEAQIYFPVPNDDGLKEKHPLNAATPIESFEDQKCSITNKLMKFLFIKNNRFYLLPLRILMTEDKDFSKANPIVEMEYDKTYVFIAIWVKRKDGQQFLELRINQGSHPSLLRCSDASGTIPADSDTPGLGAAGELLPVLIDNKAQFIMVNNKTGRLYECMYNKGMLEKQITIANHVLQPFCASAEIANAPCYYYYKGYELGSVDANSDLENEKIRRITYAKAYNVSKNEGKTTGTTSMLIVSMNESLSIPIAPPKSVKET